MRDAAGSPQTPKSQTLAASKTGPSTQTRFIARPSGVSTITVQPAQPPTAQAMNSQRDLTGQRIAPRELRDGAQHRIRSARKDLHLRECGSIEALEPAVGQLGDETIEAAGQIRTTRKTARDAPFIQQRHAPDGAGGNACRDDLRGQHAKGERNLRAHENERFPVRISPAVQMLGEKDHWRDPHSSTNEQRSRPRRVRGEASSNRPQHTDRVTGRTFGERLETRAEHFVENFDPARGRIGTHDRQRTAHGNRRIAAEVNEASGLRACRALWRLDPHDVLRALEGGVREDAPFFQGDGAAMRDAHRAVFTCFGPGRRTRRRARPSARPHRFAPGRG